MSKKGILGGIILGGILLGGGYLYYQNEEKKKTN